MCSQCSLQHSDIFPCLSPWLPCCDCSSHERSKVLWRPASMPSDGLILFTHRLFQICTPLALTHSWRLPVTKIHCTDKAQICREILSTMVLILLTCYMLCHIETLTCNLSQYDTNSLLPTLSDNLSLMLSTTISLTYSLWHGPSDIVSLTRYLWHILSDMFSDTFSPTLSLWPALFDIFSLTHLLWHIPSSMLSVTHSPCPSPSDMLFLIWSLPDVLSDTFTLTCSLWHAVSDTPWHEHSNRISLIYSLRQL